MEIFLYTAKLGPLAFFKVSYDIYTKDVVNIFHFRFKYLRIKSTEKEREKNITILYNIKEIIQKERKKFF